MDKESHRTMNRYAILWAVLIGNIVGPLDGSMVNVILPTISNVFSVPMSVVQWVPILNLTAVSTTMILFGRLGDSIGYRKPFLWGLFLFCISSFVAGFSPTISFLIFLRAVQGVGASMIMSVVLAIITNVFPSEELGYAMGMSIFSISLGLVLGPFLAGFLTSYVSWRWAFFSDGVVALIGILFAIKYIPDFKGINLKIDYLGATLFCVSCASFLVSVSLLSSYGLNTTNKILLLAATFSFALFVYVEHKKPNPLVDLKLFKNVPFSFGLLASLFVFISQFMMTFLAPFHLQRLLSYPPHISGIIIAVFPAASMISSVFTQSLNKKIPDNLLAFSSALFSALGIALLAIVPLQASIIQIALGLATYGLGTGLFQSINSKAVMATLPEQYLGIGSSLLSMIRNMGMALGVALGGLALYSLVPRNIIGQYYFSQNDASVFLHGLRFAYLISSAFSLLASVFSLGATEK
jgi:EmrB/QacA subfamily drug resistance transporter